MATNGLKTKTTVVANRRFNIQVFCFDNGNFVTITEGNNKLGAMVVSLSSGPSPITTSVIPARTDSLFLKLASESICSLIKGIAIVSLNINNELDQESAKAIMSDIMELVRSD